MGTLVETCRHHKRTLFFLLTAVGKEIALRKRCNKNRGPQRLAKSEQIPELFRNIGHDRVEEKKDIGKQVIHGTKEHVAFTCLSQVRLGSFDKLIAVATPKEVIKNISDFLEVKRFPCRRDTLMDIVKLCHYRDADISGREKFILANGTAMQWPLHLSETSRIPQLIRKIAAFFQLLFIKANVLTNWRRM